MNTDKRISKSEFVQALVAAGFKRNTALTMANAAFTAARKNLGPDIPLNRSYKCQMRRGLELMGMWLRGEPLPQPSVENRSVGDCSSEDLAKAVSRWGSKPL